MPTHSRDTFARLAPRPPDPLPADDAPAVALLTETLRTAAARGASDIHVEPSEHEWRIRLRIDGALHVLQKPPLHLRDAVITRIKVLSRMDIAERRVPQDGRLRLPLANGQIEDYRVNSLPTLFGENSCCDGSKRCPLTSRSARSDSTRDRAKPSNPRFTRRTGSSSSPGRPAAARRFRSTASSDAQCRGAQRLFGRGPGRNPAERH
jgi:hypothetical protein